MPCCCVFGCVWCRVVVPVPCADLASVVVSVPCLLMICRVVRMTAHSFFSYARASKQLRTPPPPISLSPRCCKGQYIPTKCETQMLHKFFPDFPKPKQNACNGLAGAYSRRADDNQHFADLSSCQDCAWWRDVGGCVRLTRKVCPCVWVLRKMRFDIRCP